MRLFVAVELADPVRDAALEAARDFQRRLERHLHPKWVPAGNMHLTVRFIGHVTDERLSGVLDALRPPLATAPFALALGECGVFPPKGPPRVLWIGLKAGLPSLRAMHDELDGRLSPLGFEPENRPYAAHLTLARVKDAPRGAGHVVRDAVHAVRPSAAGCTISQATLFESRPSPNGQRYTPLLQIPLTARPPARSCTP